MKKNRILKIVLTVVLALLIAASIVFYIVDIAVNGSAPTENLFKMLAAVAVCAGSMIRLFVKRGRRPLSYYESSYYDDIKGAFSSSPYNRKKLIAALRLYNEDNFGKALKYLSELKAQCKTRDDFYAVGLFTALAFTDIGYTNDAIIVYNALINMNITSSTIYGNLGNIYSGLGRHDDAIAALSLAIQNDEKNPAPYNNMAKLYFDTYDFENAKEYARRALEVNHKFRQSASLLAIIYTLENDTANAEKYSHIAIASGEDPDRLQRAIKHYMKKTASDKTDNSIDDEEEELI